jgi:hypothetical protein
VVGMFSFYLQTLSFLQSNVLGNCNAKSCLKNLRKERQHARKKIYDYFAIRIHIDRLTRPNSYSSGTHLA